MYLVLVYHPKRSGGFYNRLVTPSRSRQISPVGRDGYQLFSKLFCRSTGGAGHVELVETRVLG